MSHSALPVLITLGESSAPSATTDAASSVGITSATLNATVNPNGSSTDVYFEYGLTTSYGSTTGTQNIGSGTTDTAVNQALTGLTPRQIYHFRVVATNPAGTATGSDQTFETQPGPPIVIRLQAVQRAANW